MTDGVPSLVRTALMLARTHDSLRDIVSKSWGSAASARLTTRTVDLLQGVLQLAEQPGRSDIDERLDKLEEQIAAMVDAIRRLAGGTQESVRQAAAAAGGIDKASASGAIPNASLEDEDFAAPPEEFGKPSRKVEDDEESDAIEKSMDAAIASHLQGRKGGSGPAPNAEAVQKVIGKLVKYGD